MDSFHMKNRCQCEVELPSQNGGVFRRFVTRKREDSYGNPAHFDKGVLFFSENDAAFDGYRGYEWSEWFERSQVENDVGFFNDDNKKYPYLYFPKVDVASGVVQESGRRAQLFDGDNGEFIPLLKSLEKATRVFTNYRLETLYKRSQHLIIIPINVSSPDVDEEKDPFYRLGAVLLNYLYGNKFQYVAKREEIETLRTKLEEDDDVSDAYRYVLLRMTAPDPQLRFETSADEIVALCKEKTPNKCEYVKRNDFLERRNCEKGVYVQFFSIPPDEREQWEKLQGKLVRVDELPRALNEDEDEEEDGTLWRFEENQGETTKTIIPVAFRRNGSNRRPGRWARVGSIFQFSSLSDAAFYEIRGCFRLSLNKKRVLTFHICWPRGVPRCRLTIRTDGYANFPSKQENPLDRLYVCNGSSVQTCEVDLNGLKFPLYFRLFSETFAQTPDGECSFSLGENPKSRFVVESVEQIKENLVCLK